MAVHSSILAWEIPQTDGPGERAILSTGSRRVGHDREAKTTTCGRYTLKEDDAQPTVTAECTGPVPGPHCGPGACLLHRGQCALRETGFDK